MFRIIIMLIVGFITYNTFFAGEVLLNAKVKELVLHYQDKTYGKKPKDAAEIETRDKILKCVKTSIRQELYPEREIAKELYRNSVKHIYSPEKIKNIEDYKKLKNFVLVFHATHSYCNASIRQVELND